MSFLLGKSVSYARIAPQAFPAIGDLDKWLGAHAFTPLGPDDTDRIGACSWRNLLDGPVDRGWLPDQTMWLCGIRRDVRRAPAALVRARTAQALGDAMKAGILSSKAKAKLKEEIRKELDLEQKPRPSQAAMVVIPDRGLILVDSMASAVVGHLEFLLSCGCPLFYADHALYSEFLAWLVWDGSRDSESERPWCPGDITFCNKLDSAAYEGADIAEVLPLHLGEMDVTQVRFTWNLDGHKPFQVTLQAVGLKVNGLEFPEDVLDELKGIFDLEAKADIRLRFVDDFESDLARRLVGFLEAKAKGELPAEFLALTGGAE